MLHVSEELLSPCSLMFLTLKVDRKNTHDALQQRVLLWDKVFSIFTKLTGCFYSFIITLREKRRVSSSPTECFVTRIGTHRQYSELNTSSIISVSLCVFLINLTSMPLEFVDVKLHSYFFFFFCVSFCSDKLYGYEKFRFGTILFMVKPEKPSVCCDNLCRESMVIGEKLLYLAMVILFQYTSGLMHFMHMFQDFPASPQPSTTHRSARFTTVQPEK
jgi:hypothetical protein